uniref:WAP domain-containing protein n=1 Tax=Vombatus ursinus TaxID=29139 RepID=A0A4X2JXP8_VOMUR
DKRHRLPEHSKKILAWSTKPGTCPEDNALCRRHYEAKCQRDEECSGKQKCCFYYCHFDCKYTVEDRLSGKCSPLPAPSGLYPSYLSSFYK